MATKPPSISLVGVALFGGFMLFFGWIFIPVPEPTAAYKLIIILSVMGVILLGCVIDLYLRVKRLEDRNNDSSSKDE